MTMSKELKEALNQSEGIHGFFNLSAGEELSDDDFTVLERLVNEALDCKGKDSAAIVEKVEELLPELSASF